jgi:hypothetical protein
MDWFIAYKEVLDKYQFQAKDIYNFDETGFRVGCARGTKVIVLIDVKEVRTILFLAVFSS